MPVDESYLLDTSAVFSLTDQEEGCERVQALLRQADKGNLRVLVCAVSLMEVYYISFQEQGEDLAGLPSGDSQSLARRVGLPGRNRSAPRGAV